MTRKKSPPPITAQLDTAFKTERSDALIAVNPQPPALPTVQEDKIITAIAKDEGEKLQSEERLTIRQDRLNEKDKTTTIIWTIKCMMGLTIGWFIFVGLALAAYMIGGTSGLTLLPMEALLALIGSVALPPLLQIFTNLLVSKKAKNGDK